VEFKWEEVKFLQV